MARAPRWLRVPRAIRRLSDPIVGRVPVRIVGGVNRGARWSLASAGSGYRSGRREAAQMHLLASLIRPGDVVWDIGAHHGYVTLLASTRVGSTGAVHAFEPAPSNLRLLRRHIRWNQLTNVVVHACAIGGHDGKARFGGGSTSKQARLGGGDDEVEIRTVQSLIGRSDAPAPDFLKIDVEGAEADILDTGLLHLPPTARMLVAVHSLEVYERCAAMLRPAGYAVMESARLRAYRAGRWRGDADMFCMGPEYRGRAADAELLRAAGYE